MRLVTRSPCRGCSRERSWKQLFCSPWPGAAGSVLHPEWPECLCWSPAPCLGPGDAQGSSPALCEALPGPARPGGARTAPGGADLAHRRPLLASAAPGSAAPAEDSVSGLSLSLSGSFRSLAAFWPREHRGPAGEDAAGAAGPKRLSTCLQSPQPARGLLRARRGRAAMGIKHFSPASVAARPGARRRGRAAAQTRPRRRRRALVTR